MIKKLIVAFISFGLLIVALYTLKNANFYTPEQLDDARTKATQQARDGDFDKAIKRLQVISRYDSKNSKVWFDYLSVLSWANKTDEFFDNLDKIKYNSFPDYFLDVCISVIKTLKTKNKILQANKLFYLLLGNEEFRNSDYIKKLYIASKSSGTDKLFLNTLRKIDNNNQLLQTIKIDKYVNLARNGEIKKSIHLFDEYYKSNTTNNFFIADYITVSNWARKHTQVIKLAQDANIDLLPIHSLKSIANSYNANNQFEKSKEYYQVLVNRSNKNSEYQDKIKLLDDKITNIKEVKEEQKRKIEIAKQNELRKQRYEIERLAKQRFLNLNMVELENILFKQPSSIKYYNRWQDVAITNKLLDPNNKLDFYSNRADLFFSFASVKDSLFLRDYLILLSWDEQHQKVINQFKQLKPTNTNKQFLIAVANSAKNIKNYNLAIQLIDKAISLSDETKETEGYVDLVVNKSNILQELRKAKTSIKLLDTLTSHSKNNNQDVLFSYAGAYRQSGNSLFALHFYDRVLKLSPNLQQATYQKTLTLIESGLSFEAFEEIKKYPQLFSDLQKVNISSGMNTYKVRLAHDGIDIPEQKIAIKDALINNQKHIDMLNNTNHTLDKIIYAYADKAVLLHLDKNYKAVIELFKNTKLTFPIYALNTISSSYLALKEPKLAYEIIESVLKQDPNNFNALVNGYYAQLEMEKFDEAFDYLEILEKSVPIWLYAKQSNKSIANPNKEAIELLKPMHIAYKNRLGKAQVALEKLVDKAPLNNNYRINLAYIYRWRGWSVKSQEQLNIINNSDPTYLPLEVTISLLAKQQKAYKKGTEKLDALLTINPVPDEVRLLEKDWKLHNSNVFSIDWHQADTQGSNFSSKDEILEAAIYSQPVAYNWRGFGYYKEKFSRYLNTEHEHITTQGLGIDYRDTWGDANISLFNVEGKESHDYAIGINWQVDDYKFLHAQYQSFSDDTPIRAFHADIYTESLKFGGQYRPNEEYQYSANIGLVDFTDGNKRRTLDLNAYQPLYRDEHHILSIWEYVFAQHNSLDTNRDYFNPKSLYSISGVLDYTGILRRRYDNVFTHSATIGYGYVWQNNFSPETFIDFAYKHRWDFTKYFNLYYGIGWRQNYYDGIQENGPNYKAGLEYKF